MKSSDSLLGGYRADIEARRHRPLRSVGRHYDQERSNPSVPCVSNPPHPTVSPSRENSKRIRPGRSISSAGRSADFSASRKRCHCPPAISFYWIIIFPSIPLISRYADTHGTLGHMPNSRHHIRFTEYSLKTYIRFPICIEFTMSPAIKVLFVCVANSARSCLQRLCCGTDPRFEAFSAGSEPSEVDPRDSSIEAVKVDAADTYTAIPSASFKLIDSITRNHSL